VRKKGKGEPSTYYLPSVLVFNLRPSDYTKRERIQKKGKGEGEKHNLGRPTTAPLLPVSGTRARRRGKKREGEKRKRNTQTSPGYTRGSHYYLPLIFRRRGEKKEVGKRKRITGCGRLSLEDREGKKEDKSCPAKPRTSSHQPPYREMRKGGKERERKRGEKQCPL